MSDNRINTATSYEMDPRIFHELQQMAGNMNCIDCGDPQPDWGSPTLGILFCVQCSGQHRSLGTHITFVRSVRMDAWTDRQIALMRLGGNDHCRQFLQQHGVDFDCSSIREKYDSPGAELYRQVLRARVAGEPEPTELVKPPEKSIPSDFVKVRTMQGFGSSDLLLDERQRGLIRENDAVPTGNKHSYTIAAFVLVPVLAAAAWLVIPH